MLAERLEEWRGVLGWDAAVEALEEPAGDTSWRILGDRGGGIAEVRLRPLNAYQLDHGAADPAAAGPSSGKPAVLTDPPAELRVVRASALDHPFYLQTRTELEPPEPERPGWLRRAWMRFRGEVFWTRVGAFWEGSSDPRSLPEMRQAVLDLYGAPVASGDEDFDAHVWLHSGQPSEDLLRLEAARAWGRLARELVRTAPFLTAVHLSHGQARWSAPLVEDGDGAFVGDVLALLDWLEEVLTR